jgi:hypothetical protein
LPLITARDGALVLATLYSDLVEKAGSRR